MCVLLGNKICLVYNKYLWAAEKEWSIEKRLAGSPNAKATEIVSFS